MLEVQLTEERTRNAPPAVARWSAPGIARLSPCVVIDNITFVSLRCLFAIIGRLGRTSARVPARCGSRRGARRLRGGAAIGAAGATNRPPRRRARPTDAGRRCHPAARAVDSLSLQQRSAAWSSCASRAPSRPATCRKRCAPSGGRRICFADNVATNPSAALTDASGASGDLEPWWWRQEGGDVRIRSGRRQSSPRPRAGDGTVPQDAARRARLYAVASTSRGAGRRPPERRRSALAGRASQGPDAATEPSRSRSPDGEAGWHHGNPSRPRRRRSTPTTRRPPSTSRGSRRRPRTFVWDVDDGSRRDASHATYPRSTPDQSLRSRGRHRGILRDELATTEW